MLALQSGSQFQKISAASSVGWCLSITSFFHPFLIDLVSSEEDDINHENVAVHKEAARILTVKVLRWVFSLRIEVAEVSWKGWSTVCCRGRHWPRLFLGYGYVCLWTVAHWQISFPREFYRKEILLPFEIIKCKQVEFCYLTETKHWS